MVSWKTLPTHDIILGLGNPVLPISELSMVCIELELFSWLAS
jgi:hypothetical protein